MGEVSDKAKGKAKQLEGRVTGDRSRRAEGRVDEFKGNVKGIIRKVRDAAKNVAGLAKDATKNRKKRA